MSQSLFIKPCKKCNGSGKAGDIHQGMEVCPECNGAKSEVDYDYLQLFERQIWEVLPNEKDSSISFVRDVNDGIESVRGLPEYPKDFLARLYHIRGNLFQLLGGIQQRTCLLCRGDEKYKDVKRIKR